VTPADQTATASAALPRAQQPASAALPRAQRAAGERRRTRLERSRLRLGFSLIEMLAVMLLVSIVFFAAANFYRQLSSASARAADLTRSARRAVSLLDRVARDLESTLLVKKPDGTDALDHPWLFLGESEPGGNGAERLKFVTRSPNPRSSEGSESDLAVVSWLLLRDEDGDLTLRRGSVPRLPESLDRDFPPAEETFLVARGLSSFGVRFMNQDGEWKSAWDSSQLADADDLPIAAEIEVGILPPDAAATQDGVAPEAELYTRRVLLPVRPLDMKALVTGEESQEKAAKDEDGDGVPDEPEEGEEEEAQACVTVRQCLARNPQAAEAAASFGLSEVLESIGDQCFSTVAGSLPPGLTVQGCE